MEYYEQERKLRHMMCVLMSLETLVICFFICRFVVDTLLDGWVMIYFRESDPIGGTMLSIMLVLIPIILTIGSMHSRGVYMAYEIVHCVFGAVIFLVGFMTGHYFIHGLIMLLLLSFRFFIYLTVLKEIREEHNGSQ